MDLELIPFVALALIGGEKSALGSVRFSRS